MSIANKLISRLRKGLKHKYASENILILSFKFLGDTVFTIPAIEAIKFRYSNHKITIYCFPESKEIYELYFKDINFRCFSKREVDIHVRRPGFKLFNLIKETRKNKPYIIFDFTVNYKSAAICLFSGSAISVGLGNKLLAECYDYFSPKPTDCHLMDMFLYSVRNFINSDTNILKEYTLTINSIKKIVIHPFAGWAAKEWNLTKFIDLARKLKDDFEVSFIAKADCMSANTVNLLNDYGIKTILTKEIKELIQVVYESDLILSNDTGIIYIGSLLGKSTYTIYGPTNPAFSVPFGEHHSYIQKKIKCSPEEGKQYCYTQAGQKGCPSFECMNQLTVDEVYNDLQKFIIKLHSGIIHNEES